MYLTFDSQFRDIVYVLQYWKYLSGNCFYLFIYLFIHLFIYVFIYLFIHLFIDLSIYLFISLLSNLILISRKS